MNYLIQRGKVRGQMINVPDGLPEILSDITREVLRCQPSTECLCQFIIDYLHSVLVTRQKARVAKYIIDDALKQVDEIIADLCICDIPKSTASEMAVIMEQSFRRFLEKYRCEHRMDKEMVKFDEIDILDELIKKCKMSQKDLQISQPLIEEAYNRFVKAYMTAAEASEGTEALYEYFKNRELQRVELDLQTKAAVKIQAIFRGFRVRRSLDFVKPKEVLVQTQKFEEAECTIQNLFRTGPFKEDDGVPDKDPCTPKSDLSIDPNSQLGQTEAEEADATEKTSAEKLLAEAPAVETEADTGAPPADVPATETAPEPEPVAAAPEPEPEPVAAPEQPPEPEVPAEPAEAPAESAPAEPAE